MGFRIGLLISVAITVAIVTSGLASGSAGCAPGFTNPDGTCNNGDPRLRFSDAHQRAATVLQREEASYQAGYARKIGCGLRLTPARIRCRVSWIVGDVSFKGTVTISNIQGQYGSDDWRYRYRVEETNEYCLSTDGSGCVDVQSGSGHG